MYTTELVLLRLQLQEISTRVHKLRRIMQHIKWSGIDLGHCGQPCNILDPLWYPLHRIAAVGLLSIMLKHVFF